MNSNFAVQPPGVAEPIMKAMPNAVQVGSFGMTEAAGTVCTGSHEEPESQRITRLGKPLPGLEVRILDPETQRDAAVGGRGEVLVRGYSLLEGYYKDAEKTAQALDAEGWYHTGDIGSLDEHGTIMFHGRFKDMLKVGGENVAAAEIEALLGRHPAVKLAQVVGIPDPKYAEVPAAFVELKPGEAAGGQRADRVLPPVHRGLQGAARGALRVRMAHVHQQDPEIPLARAAAARARAAVRS